MDDHEIQKLHEVYGGPMSGDEVMWLQGLHNLIEFVLNTGQSFALATDLIWRDLRLLARCRLDFAAASSDKSGLVLMNWAKQSTNGAPHGAHEVSPLSSAETSFLRDIQGLIRFAVRNGLGVTLVLEVLSHDFVDIIAHDGSLDRAKAMGLRPKAEGWSQLTEDSVGEPVEDSLAVG